MSKIHTKLTTAFVLAASAVFAQSSANRPTGFLFFDRHLTIKPYVSLSFTYDSNIDGDRSNNGDCIFSVNPAVDFVWHGAKWNLLGTFWYRHYAFCKYSSEMGEDSFGESLRYNYSSSDPSTKGWSLMLAQRYAHMSQSDSLDSSDGRGIWRDRQTIDVSGVLERRFTERWHADVQAQYSLLDYENRSGKYVPLNGWDQYSAGAQIGYAASRWTDMLVAAGYSRYVQDYEHWNATSRKYSTKSNTYSIQAGIGTRATERISYRALAGASWLDYAGTGQTDNGWTYTLAGNWRVHRQVQISVMGSSYYQPSDQYVGQANKVYTFSGGVSYLTLGDRLNLTGNVSWNFYDTCYADPVYSKSYSSDRTYISTRFAADLLVNRWMSLFAHVIWDKNMYEQRSQYDYNRVRGVMGVRFHY